jgi:hypothetical protein
MIKRANRKWGKGTRNKRADIKSVIIPNAIPLSKVFRKGIEKKPVKRPIRTGRGNIANIIPYIDAIAFPP